MGSGARCMVCSGLRTVAQDARTNGHGAGILDWFHPESFGSVVCSFQCDVSILPALIFRDHRC